MVGVRAAVKVGLKTDAVLLRRGLENNTAAADIAGPMPTLTINESGGRVRLALGGFAQGEGSSLQEAADALVSSILRLVLAFRSSGFTAASEFRPDLETMSFLYELGEIAAAGGDIRARLFA
jgi:hypothetical protein